MAVTFIQRADDGTLLTKTLKSDFSAKVYPLICDRLTLTCDLPESTHPTIIKNFKDEGAKPSAGYQLSGWIKELVMKTPPYIPQDEDDVKLTSATIQCKPFSSGAAFLRLDFNPSKVNLLELKWFIENNWLTLKNYGFDYILKHGKVTRIDFAVDIACEEVDKFYYQYPNIQIVEVIRSKSGRTEYLGGKTKTGKRIAIYDRIPAIKAQNAKKAYDPKLQIAEPDQPVMRIEMRLYPDIKFSNLFDLKNPFEGLTVSSFKDDADGDPMWKLFLALARFEGAQASLGRLTKQKRAEYVTKLKKGMVGWWKPAYIWDQLPAVLSSITSK